MNYYKLSGVVNDKEINVNKNFRTRNEAMDYMFNYLNKQFVYNTDIEEEYSVENKHDIEYVLGNNNRFRIVRASI